ncbi:MAG: four helix bundle protein [Brevefilum sp.]|nr:four helix bundle protein [Brevefilum sp.]
MEGLNRLKVYQHAQELGVFVYQHVLPEMPSEEKYCLTSQIRRAAASIPANVAEGYGRYYYQESIRFCYLARGSLMELSSHIDLAVSQGYLAYETKTLLKEKMAVLLKLIQGYVNYLKESKRGWNEPGSQSISDEQAIYLMDDAEDLEASS